MAYVFDNLKMILIRVPKTGSTSQVKAMTEANGARPRVIGEPHADALDGKVSCPEWNEYRKIGFIREPMPWVLSFFRFCAGTNPKGFVNAHDPIAFTAECPTPMSWLVHPTTDELLVDEVWRTEDLGKFFDMLDVAAVKAHVTPEKKRRLWAKTPKLMAALHSNFDREFPFYENTRT